ncbi:MAG: T9SS type A sorting domain-containing protein [Saprospiraceae bacterium]|nr:T9SS type A sorting domain-containing protein [Saprospiraceae bacterium]
MKTPCLFSLLLIVFGLKPLHAQVWERYYPGSGAIEIASQSGDSLTLLACVPGGRAYLHIDGNDGQLQSSQAAGLCEPASTFDGGTVSATAVEVPGRGKEVRLQKLDANGNLAWELMFGDTLKDTPLRLVQTRDSGFVLISRRQWNYFNDDSPNIDVWRIGKDGDILWGGNYFNVYSPWDLDANIGTSLHNDDIIVYYITEYAGHAYSSFKVLGEDGLVKYWNTIYDEINFPNITYVSGTAWGGVQIKYDITIIPSQGFPYTIVSKKTFDENGELTTNPRYAVIGQALPDGGTLYAENNYASLLVARVNAAGETLSHAYYTGTAKDLVQTATGEVFIAGIKYGQPIGQTWLMKLDPQAFITDEYLDVCEGNYFGPVLITQDTVVVDTFDLAGQDSIVFYHLQVHPSYHLSLQLSLCEGSSIVFGDSSISHTGIYIDSLLTVFGCDSIVTLNLSFLPADTVSTTIELCQHEASPLTGIVYGDQGEFAEQMTLTNQYGCDSLVLAEVVVHPEEFIDAWVWVPYGYTENGIVYTHDTIFYSVDTTAYGCPFYVIFSVTVGPNSTDELQRSLKLQVQPNPVDDAFNLEFDLAAAAELSVVAFDPLGRQVADLLHGKSLPGHHQIRVVTADWPSGVYTLLVHINGRSISRRIVNL